MWASLGTFHALDGSGAFDAWYWHRVSHGDVRGGIIKVQENNQVGFLLVELNCTEHAYKIATIVKTATGKLTAVNPTLPKLIPEGSVYQDIERLECSI